MHNNHILHTEKKEPPTKNIPEKKNFPKGADITINDTEYEKFEEY